MPPFMLNAVMPYTATGANHHSFKDIVVVGDEGKTDSAALVLNRIATVKVQAGLVKEAVMRNEVMSEDTFTNI